MLTFVFFISAFVSSSWFIYAIIYVNNALGEKSFTSLPLEESSMYVALILLPVLIMWMIFGYAHQFFAGKYINKRTYKLLQQMKKNQDYADFMVRIMIDAEHEIKDGFILNKFDVFISDLNEMLADILMRCNLVSSGQMENLWNKVLHGERWSIAKILIAQSPVGINVAEKILEYAKRDSIVAGTLMEFCSRYQTLVGVLEKHDQDAIFLNIVQTGVMGKAYSILAPVSEQIQYGFSKKFDTTNPSRLEPTATSNPPDENNKPEAKKSLVSALTAVFHKNDESDDDDNNIEGTDDSFSSALSSLEKIEPTFSSGEISEPADDRTEPTLSDENNQDNNTENPTTSMAYPFGE